MNESKCYLSNDFSKVNIDFCEFDIICPENLLNGKQIQNFVASLKESPKKFCTTSLYLLREIYLQECPCIFILIIDGEVLRNTNDFDDLYPLEILDRELEQSDRYMNFENKKCLDHTSHE